MKELSRKGREVFAEEVEKKTKEKEKGKRKQKTKFSKDRKEYALYRCGAQLGES